MLILLPVGILILTSAGMLVIHATRPRFAYHWLLAVSGVLLAWFAVLALGFQVPAETSLGTWSPEELFPASPGLFVDRTSWPLAVGVMTLLLAMMLTEVVRAITASWSVWACGILFTAFGLLGVLARNPVTLLLAWTACDLFELVLVFGFENKPDQRKGAILVFSTRVSGSLLLLGASLFSPAGAGILDISSSPASSTLFVLLSVILRLGVLPVNPPVLSDRSLRQSLGTILRLVAVSTGMVLMLRTVGLNSSIASSSLFFGGLMVILGLLAIYAGASWLLSQDELDGRPAWILGWASLSIASALRGQPEAALAWTLACLFSGGMAFLSSYRTRISRWISITGVVGISALPFTPAWTGIHLFTQPFDPVLALFLVALVLLLAGFLHHIFRPLGFRMEGERWIQVIYPFGLVLFPLTHFALGFYIRRITGDAANLDWAIGPILVLLATGWILWERRGGRFPLPILNILDSFFSFRWLSKLLYIGYQYLGRLIYFISRVLEGDGGVLWVLLWIILLMAFLVIADRGDL